MHGNGQADAWRAMDLFAPTDEHRMLVATMRDFVRD